MEGSDHFPCRLCGFHGSDVMLEPCGCWMHARCVPIHLLVTRSSHHSPSRSTLEPTPPASQSCPCCPTPLLVTSIYLSPMTLDDLDRASHLKRQAAQAANAKQAAADRSWASSTNLHGKRERSEMNGASLAPCDADVEVQAETPYLLLLNHSSHPSTTASSLTSSSLSSSLDSDYLRTGRWTEEETAYVDFLVEAFDRGQLVMPQGIRLNDMLRDLLLCKASRLTKKMKHAKLSARSYDLQVYQDSCAVATSAQSSLNRVMLSSLEQQFLASITSEATRLELRCIMSKSWRSFLSNLCLQVGSEVLNAHDWLASLEHVETRASDAERVIRNARRRRMGMALKTDLKAAHYGGVFISGMPTKRQQVDVSSNGVAGLTHRGSSTFMNNNVQSIHHGSSRIPSSVDLAGTGNAASSNQSVTTTSSSQGDHDSEYISQILDFGDNNQVAMNGVGSSLSTVGCGNNGSNTNNNSNMEYLTMLFDTLVEKRAPPDALSVSETSARHNGGPFLDTLMTFVESNDLPFEHIDVWVPSYHNCENQQSGGTGAEMRLFHAGYVTRADVDPARYAQLNEYGEYSTKFSFQPGCGLPGRVYSSGEPSWERGISDVDPKIFERAGGARVYRVNTGFGIPISTPAISRMVVVMYSGSDVPEDANIVEMCRAELLSYDPEPKWKLVVDMPSAHAHLGSARHRSPSVGSANSSIASKVASEEEEHRIATMLGDHIPLTELPGAKVDLSLLSLRPDTLVPHFMYLRLLLLRPRDKRSARENEAIDIIKKSYRGYSHDSKRNDKEIAYLLVRDWQFLQQGLQAALPPPRTQPLVVPEAQYRSHQFTTPNNLSTYSTSGAPTRMPSVLSFVDPSHVARKNSHDGAGMTSSASGQAHPRNINIVDESAD